MLKITEHDFRMEQIYHYNIYPSVKEFLKTCRSDYSLEFIGKAGKLEVYLMYQDGVKKPVSLVTVEE
jgi:hypothetical protein